LGWILAAGDAGSCRFDGVAMMWRRALVVWYVNAVLLAVCWLLLSSRVEAAAIPLQVSAGVARSAASSTGYITTAASAWSGAAYNSGLTAQVAGKAVTVPASWRMATNAGQVALGAMRLNPLGLAAGAAASWLLTYGIQKCLDGTWCAQSQDVGDPNPAKYWYSSSYPSESCPGNGRCGWQAAHDSVVAQYIADKAQAGMAFVGWGSLTVVNANTATHVGRFKTAAVPGGYDVTFGFSAFGARPVELAPAKDADWAKVDPLALPDAVLNNLGKDGVFLDVAPQVNTARQGITLGLPYIDPVTGKTFQDMGYITPAPDGKTADLQVAKQEVDANGNPVTDPGTGQPKQPEKTDDPCLAHPNRLGCMDKGDVPDAPDLQKSEKVISITPDSGWGPDTMACPADIVNNLRSGGQVVAWSFRPACDFADGVRAPVIAFAWLAAVLIALGVGSKGSE